MAVWHEGIDEYNRGDFTKARELFDHALEIRADLPGPWRYLALMAANEKRYGDCVSACKQALCLNPTSKFAPMVRDLSAMCGKALAGEEPELAAIPPPEEPPPAPCTPVQVTATNRPPTSAFALVLAVDGSGSMSGPKLEMTKKAAMAVLAALDPKDFVGVIAFDTEARVAVTPQPAGNRAAIKNGIGSLKSGGGTNVYAALVQAYRDLAAVPATAKHLILLTDGQSPYDCIEALAKKMLADGITITTIGIGDADRALLAMIADAANGRSYAVCDVNTLSLVFAEELRQARSRTVPRK
jgi:hypothetical protein